MKQPPSPRLVAARRGAPAPRCGAVALAAVLAAAQGSTSCKEAHDAPPPSLRGERDRTKLVRPPRTLVRRRVMHDDRSSRDRRTEPRADVAIWVEEQTREALYFQRAKNLSMGGVFLEGTLPHPPGTRVALDLELSDHGIVRVEGEVVDHAPGQLGMGVRFVELDERARSRLRAYLGG